MGCWAFGGGDYWGPQDQRDVEQVVHAALDRGINYFDTAPAYNDGRSEEALGAALRGRRHEAVVGTKVGPAHVEPAVLRRQCEESLRRLQTDVIDLYMVHWPMPGPAVPAAFATLEALRAEGKIRAVGVSNFGVIQLGEVFATGVRVDVNQLCYNLLCRAIEGEILPLCRREGIGVLAYMPLLQGILTGRYHSVEEIPPLRRRTRHFGGDTPGARHGEAGAEAETMQALAEIRVVAEGLGVPMGRLALAWAMARPGVSTALVGIRNLEQLEENAAAAALSPAPETMARLDAVTEPLRARLGDNADYWQGWEARRTR